MPQEKEPPTGGSSDQNQEVKKLRPDGREFDGVLYEIVEYVGSGWGSGCGSLVRALSGEHAGKLFRANINNGGLSNMKEVKDESKDESKEKYDK